MRGKVIPVRPLPEQRRRRWACAVVVLVAILCSFGLGRWDGRNSTHSLPYVEAVEITEDDSTPSERRKAAILRILTCTEYAGRALREAERSQDVMVSQYARETRERIVAQWR